MRKKELIVFSVVSLVASMLAACGGKEKEANPPANAPTPAPGTASVPPPSNEPMELYFRMNVGSITNDEGFMAAFGDMIKKKFPNVTPKMIPSNVTIKSIVETKQPFDILYDAYGGIHSNLMEYALQYDVSDLIKTYKFDLSTLEQTAVDGMRSVANGGMYGIPVTVDSINLLYNKGLFDRFGVPYPTDSMTWEDMYDLTRRIARTQDGVQYYGVGMSLYHLATMDPLSPVFIDPAKTTATFTSEKYTKMFQTLMGFFTIAGNQMDDKTWAYAEQLKMFGEQRLAMLLGPSALGTRYYADKDKALDWNVAAYPRYKDLKDKGAQLSPGYFMVTSTSKYKEMAFQIAAYVTTPEFQKHLARRGYMPASKDPSIVAEYGKDLPFMAGKNIKALVPNQPAPIAPLTKYQSLTNAELNEAQKAVVVNKVDINTALREANERIDKKIAEQKGK